MKNMNVLSSQGTRKQYKTQRGTIEGNQSQYNSGQFDLYKPLFNNAILNQTQDYAQTSTQFGFQSSKQNLLPDVSQQTIPIMDILNNKFNQANSQGGQRTIFRNNLREMSIQQIKKNEENNQIMGLIQVTNISKAKDDLQTFGQESYYLSRLLETSPQKQEKIIGSFQQNGKQNQVNLQITGAQTHLIQKKHHFVLQQSPVRKNIKIQDSSFQQLAALNQSTEVKSNDNTLDLVSNLNRYQMKNMNVLSSQGTRKQYKTQRGTIEGNQSQYNSGQFDLYKPLFNNAILNQTQDYAQTSTQFGFQSSKQNLLPDVSQQTIPIMDIINQKFNQANSQGGQRTIFRNNLREMSIQQIKKNEENNQIMGLIQVANISKAKDDLQTFGQESLLQESLVRNNSKELKQQKLNILNRSFMVLNQSKRKNQRFSNDFQSMDFSNGRPNNIDEHFQSQENTLNNSQHVINQTQQNQIQASLLRNQRLKLLDTIKRKSQPQSNKFQQENRGVQKIHPKLSQNLDNTMKIFDTDRQQNSVSSQQNVTAQQFQIHSQPHSFIAFQDSKNSSKEQNILDSERDNAEALNDASFTTGQFENQTNSFQKHIVIKQRYKKNSEVGTQTGNGEYLQSLANQKHQNLKKLIDNLAKEVDISEIDIEAKQRIKTYEKFHSCKDKHQIYLQSIVKLVDLLFEDQQQSQFFGQKMTSIIRKQFSRLTNGTQQSFTQIINTHQEIYQRQAQQFQLFKSSLQKLSDQLKETHIQLMKEKELNYEEYLNLDKQHPTRKAFELLGSLNTLLQDSQLQQQPLQSGQETLTLGGINSIDDFSKLNELNSLGDNFKNEAVSMLEEFDQIDQLPDAFDRKMRKTQLLMQLQASDVTRTLKEVHQILILKNNSVLNKQATMGGSQSDQMKDEQRQLKLLEDIEFEISQRFTNVQKLTALKVLNRYFKPKNFKDVEVQADELKIFEKYSKKKIAFRELRDQKESIERQSIDLGRQLKFAVEESIKIKTHLKLQEVTLKDQEEKLSEYLKKEVYFKVKNDDLSRKLLDLDLQHQKMKQEREYLQQKIQKKIEKMQKLQLEMNEANFNKNESERKMKLQIEQLQENYKIMSEAYVKERKHTESLLQGSKIDNQSLINRENSQLNESQIGSYRQGTNQSYVEDDNQIRNTQLSKSESPHKKSMFGAGGKNGTGRNDNNNSNVNNKAIRQFNTSGSIDEEGQGGQNGSKYRNNKFNNQEDRYGSKKKSQKVGNDENDKDGNNQQDSDLDDAMNGSYDNSHINLKSLIKHDNQGQDSTINGFTNNKSVKFTDSLHLNDGIHRSMIINDANNTDSQDLLLLEQDSMNHNLTSTNRKNKYADFKFADFMKPTKQKSSSKHATQFDEMSYHLLHMEKCGPNCAHLNRSNMRSPNKNKRQLLPLKKQKLELDD
eukprot:403362812